MQPLPPSEVDSQTLNRLPENERHFHTIQAGVRGLASTWALAAFAGIAVLLQQKSDTTWVFPSFALIIVICLMANIGLSVSMDHRSTSVSTSIQYKLPGWTAT